MAVAMRTGTNGRLAGHGVALKGRNGRSLRVAPAVRTRTVVVPRATYVLHAICPTPARHVSRRILRRLLAWFDAFSVWAGVDRLSADRVEVCEHYISCGMKNSRNSTGLMTAAHGALGATRCTDSHALVSIHTCSVRNSTGAGRS